jgi:hypothetical protein
MGRGMVDVGCRARSCPSCGKLWLGDCAVMMRAAADEIEGAVTLITVTAPGAGRLLTNPRTGKVVARVAREWNSTCSMRWRALWQVASARPRRLARRYNIPWSLIARAFEPQARGVLHVHVVVPYGTDDQRCVTELLLQELVRHAGDFAFGFVDRGRMVQQPDGRWARELPIIPPGEAAGYVAGYLAGSKPGDRGIAEVARMGAVVGPILHVSSELKRRSGVSMRSLRARRRVLGRCGGHCDDPEEWLVQCQLDALERGVAPLDAWSELTVRSALVEGSATVVVDAATGEVIPPSQAPFPGRSGGCAELLALQRRAIAVLRLDLVSHRDSDDKWIEPHAVVECLFTRPIAPP